MGAITQDFTNFKSSSYLFSKIKREFRSFGDANLIDDNDFPGLVAEVLKKLGISTYKEEEVVLTVKDYKACLPKDFKEIYAAYKCCPTEVSYGDRHLQHAYVLENDITCEILGRRNNCQIHCDCPDKIIERVEVRQYVNDGCITRKYKRPTLLKLSPNVKTHGQCSNDCLNLLTSCPDEINIKGDWIYTNFCDGDILLKYYAFPLDDDGIPMLPDIVEVEKACEWYIKWQLLLNLWLVDDLPNAVNKWQKAEAEFNKWMAEARYILKLPRFSQLVNSIRTQRGTSSLNFFSQQDRRY